METEISAQSTDDRWRLSLQLLLGLGLTVLFFYMMAPFLIAILLGGVFAIVCYPLYRTLRRFLPSPLSAFLVTLGMTLGILVPVVLMLYNGVYRLLDLIAQLKLLKSGHPLQALSAHPLIDKIISETSRFFPINRAWLKTQALEATGRVIETTSAAVAHFLAGMPGFILALFILILSLYFFLADGAKFLSFLASLSPIQRERSRELYSAFESSCRGVMLGLFVSALLQAALMVLFFILTGLPNAFLIGLITLVAAMVPVIGSSPIWIGATLYHFLTGHWGLGIVLLIGGVLIAVSDNIIRPWIMRGSAEMHPLLALVSVFGAINLLGPTGLFLGPVIAAVFVSFLKILSLELRRENRMVSRQEVNS